MAALIDMYGRSGEASSCRQLFDEMLEPDPICCTAVISALTRCDLYLEALGMFHEVCSKFGFLLDSFTLTFGSALTALGNLERLRRGKEVHALIVTGGMEEEQMIEEGHKADYISFIEVLFACSHSGLVEEGRKYFILMCHEFGIKPQIEHYSCMVDLLSRAGEIEEAEDLIMNSEFRSNPSLWEGLLGACVTATNPNVAERIAKKVIELKPDYPLSYVHLANVYRTVGRCSGNLETNDEQRCQE